MKVKVMSTAAVGQAQPQTEISDPLGILSESKSLCNVGDKQNMISTSAMTNDTPNICPKCKGDMDVAYIPKEGISASPSPDVSLSSFRPSGLPIHTTQSSLQSVFFCDKCRVTHPMRNS